MSVNEAIELLIREGYIINVKNKYTLTGSFHRNYVPVSQESGLVVSKKEVVKSDTSLIPSNPIVPIKELLRKFREDAEIPFRIKSNTGQTYTVSAISTDAEKAFANILKSGVDYHILVYATKLYYKRDSFRKILTNYLKDGDWEVEVTEFKKKLETGSIQNHITKELSSSQSNVESI